MKKERMKRYVATMLLFVSLAAKGEVNGQFCIASGGKTSTIVVDVDDWKGVIRAARNS